MAASLKTLNIILQVDSQTNPISSIKRVTYRPCGRSKSRMGPDGTIPVGLMVPWLR